MLMLLKQGKGVRLQWPDPHLRKRRRSGSDPGPRDCSQRCTSCGRENERQMGSRYTYSLRNRVIWYPRELDQGVASFRL